MALSLTCRGRYATRAVLEIVSRNSDQPISLTAIEKSQGISKKYLQQLFAALKVAGLIRVVKGNKGGFLLAKPPAKITVYEILVAVEGDIELAECVTDRRMCDRADSCPSIGIWSHASKLLIDYFKSVNLEQALKIEAVES